MQEIKTELWNNHSIRFIFLNDEWYAVANDVCDALAIKNRRDALKTLKGVAKADTLTEGGKQEVNIIPEKDIYRLAFKSRKAEAEEFQDWVLDAISLLRKSTGLEGFQAFRMLDKEHQKEAMKKLNEALANPARVDFIKANTITNTAIKKKYGLDKQIKKDDMTPQMLVDREPILEATTDLMITHAKYGVPEHVSKVVYEKFAR